MSETPENKGTVKKDEALDKRQAERRTGRGFTGDVTETKQTGTEKEKDRTERLGTGVQRPGPTDGE